MNIVIRRAFVASLIVFLFAPLARQAANTPGSEVSFEATVDWERGILTLEGERNLEGNYAGNSARARRRILSERAPAFRNAVRTLAITSTDTGEDIISDNPEILEEIDNREQRGTAGGVRPSEDLLTARTRIEYPLYETVAAVIRSHEIPKPVPEAESWVPSKEYTGVVIDARGQLPVHGEERQDHLHPTLLPKLYDSNTRLLLDGEMIEPEYIRRWGSVGFTTSSELEASEERIGDDPMFVAADGLFGERPANPIIPYEAAEQLLTIEHNRKMLSEGRVVILVDPESLEQ